MADDLDVLVVGAGPVGLMLASELARHGARCRVVDVSEAPSTRSKAMGVHARTLEIFEQLGIADEALARGRPVHAVNTYSAATGAEGPSVRRIAHVSFEDLDSPYPFILSL